MKHRPIYVVHWGGVGASGWARFTDPATADRYAKTQRDAYGHRCIIRKNICKVPVGTKNVNRYLQEYYPHCLGED